MHCTVRVCIAVCEIDLGLYRRRSTILVCELASSQAGDGMTRNQQRSHKRKKKATSPRETSGHDVPKPLSAEPTAETVRRTAETVRLIEHALEQPVDLPLLRRLACERGLVSRRLRRQCWPLLLGLDPQPQLQSQSPPRQSSSSSPRGRGGSPVVATAAAGFDAALYERWHDMQHRDSQVVVVDVERSLWSFTPGMGDEARQVLRDQLRRLLNAAVGQYSGQYAASSPDGGGSDNDDVEGGDPGSAVAGGHAKAGESLGQKEGGVWRRRRRLAEGRDEQEDPEPGDGSRQRCQEDEVSQQSEAETRSRHSDDEGLQQQQQQQQQQLQVHYYQGLHDVASVLLMELGGEAAAFPLLSRLVVGHLRDCTRASLEPVLELLELVWPLLDHVDRPLGCALRALGLPAYFALTWFITWFAHDAKTLGVASRLFDVFMASHPLMPMYVGVAAMVAMRATLLACNEMHEAHAALSHIDLMDSRGEAAASAEGTAAREGQHPQHPQHLPLPLLERLLSRAVSLMERVPPHVLLAQSDVQPMRLCVSPWATLDAGNGQWVVPEATPLSAAARSPPLHQHGGNSGNGFQRFLSSVWPRDGGNKQHSKRPRALAALSVVSVYLLAALVGYATLRGGGMSGDTGSR